MALPSEKLRAYRPLLEVLAAELLREFDQEQAAAATFDDTSPPEAPAHAPEAEGAA